MEEPCNDWNVSIRPACGILKVDTRTYHYEFHRPGQANLQAVILEIFQMPVHYGYRHLHLLLQREG